MLVPNFGFRVICACLFSAFFILNRPTLKRTHVYSGLLISILLCFYFSTSWNCFPLRSQNIVCACIIFIIAVLWAYSSSANLRYKVFSHSSYFYMAIIALFLYVVNYAPLRADIAWRGDEDYLILTVNTLYDCIHNLLFMYKSAFSSAIGLAALIGICVFIWFYVKYSNTNKISGYLSVTVFLLISAFAFMYNILSFKGSFLLKTLTEDAVRYLFLQKWFSALFVSIAQYKDIALYRAVPFMASIFLAWFISESCYRRTNDRWVSVLFTLGIMTVPVIYYYGSILYLEMPAILLMTICIFDIDGLISSNSSEIKKRLSWYSLLMIPLFKESFIMFLFGISGLRFFYHLIVKHEYKIKSIFKEVRLSILMFVPLIIYLSLRFLSSERVWHRETQAIFHIFKTSNYVILANSVIRQYGILLILGIMGLCMLFKKKEVLRAVSFLVLIVIINAGILVIFWNEWLGDSRWNILSAPIFIGCAYYLITNIRRTNSLLICAVMLISNFTLSPFHFDGTHKYTWESTPNDTADYTYPYERTILWIKENLDPRHILLSGHYYTYRGLNFYFAKYYKDEAIMPNVTEITFGISRFGISRERILLQGLFDHYTKNRAKMESIDTIVYHSVNNIALDTNVLYGGDFKIVTKISNPEHSLYVFSRLNND